MAPIPKRQDIDEQVRAQLLAAAPAAAAFLADLVQDESAPMRCRVDAAKTILDRSGHPAYARPDESGELSFGEMTADALRKFITTSREELARRAQPVGDAPNGSVIDHIADFIE